MEVLIASGGYVNKLSRRGFFKLVGATVVVVAVDAKLPKPVVDNQLASLAGTLDKTLAPMRNAISATSEVVNYLGRPLRGSVVGYNARIFLDRYELPSFNSYSVRARQTIEAVGSFDDPCRIISTEPVWTDASIQGFCADVHKMPLLGTQEVRRGEPMRVTIMVDPKNADQYITFLGYPSSVTTTTQNEGQIDVDFVCDGDAWLVGWS